MHIPKSLLFFMFLLISTQMIGMKRLLTINNDEAPPFVTLLEELATTIIAFCEDKDMLRQTCRHFNRLASSKTNKDILVHPQLWLKQETLNLLLLEYGALGEIEIVLNLLDQGANPNTCDGEGRTVKHYAEIGCYDELLKHPKLAVIDVKNTVSDDDHMQFLKSLIGMDCELLDLVKPIIVYGYAKYLKMLIDGGVNINTRDKDGNLPLCRAIKKGLTKIVAILLHNGAHVDQEDARGDMPLHCASSYGYKEMVAMLLRHGANPNQKDTIVGFALHAASAEGHADIVEMLLRYGANVNEANDNGMTALHAASMFSHVDVVTMLLAKGANVNEVCLGKIFMITSQVTPLDCTQDWDIKKILRDHNGKTFAELNGIQ